MMILYTQTANLADSACLVLSGEAQVDAHSILLTCCVAIYMGFPFGMSTAATIRVGNLVGANRPSEARLSGRLCN